MLEEKNKIKKEEIDQLSSFAKRNQKMVSILEKEKETFSLLKFFFPLLVICFSTVIINPPKAYAIPSLPKQAVVLNQPIGNHTEKISKALPITKNITKNEKKEIQQKQEKKTQQQRVSAAHLKERLIEEGSNFAHITENQNKEIQCFGSGVQYKEKKKYIQSLENHSAQPISNQAIEFDHVLSKPIYDAAGLPYKDGFSVARTSFTHRILTARQEMKWDKDIKYKHGRDGMVGLLTSVVNEKANLLESCVENDPNFLLNEHISLDQATDILRIGLSVEIDAYKETTQNDFSWPLNDGIRVCEKAKKEASQFLTDIGEAANTSSGVNAKKAEELFLKKASKIKKVTQIAHSLNNFTPEDTPKFIFLKIAYGNFVREMENVVSSINSFGGNISNQQKNEMLYPKRLDLLDLDDVENEMRSHFFLNNRKQIVYSIWYKSQNIK